jgi:DNA-binding MarR family transcriptional regulator
MDEIDRIIEQWNREFPDLDVSPTHTLQRITRLSLLQGVSFARVFAPYGISFGEYLVLAALRRAGPPYRMNPTRLFNSVILSSGAMTNRLDRLEEMGLVERQPDPNDRRGRLVALTDRGRELVDAAVIDHLENEQRLLGALDAAEREQLAGLLRKLLLSPPFHELDPAAGWWDTESDGEHRDGNVGPSKRRANRSRASRSTNGDR